MKLTRADLRELRLSLAAALLMIALGATGVHLALASARQARTEQSAAQRQRDEIDGKLRRVRSEEAEIKQKSALFSRLQQRGMIGEEQRLDWVELLKTIRERRRLLDLRYEIAPQRALDALPGGALSFYASAMKIELKLLHEEDLTRLLDDLRQQAGPLIQVKSCKLARLPRAGGGIAAQLQADCQIDWITLHTATAQENLR
jgi:cell division protein FtsL